MRRSLALALLAACAAPTASETDDPDDTGTVPTEHSGDGPGTTHSTTEDVSAGLTGTVTGPDGPMEGVNVRFCRGLLCRNAQTEASGVYVYDQVAVAQYALEIVPPAGSGLTTACLPLTFASGEQRVVDLELLPHDPPSRLGSAREDHATGAGLYLTLSADDLATPDFEDPATEVAGVAVPDSAWGPVDGITGTVLGMWYLEPFNYPAADPGGIPARFTDAWSTTEGTTLEVYVAQYPDGIWVSAGTASPEGGDLVGASLPFLSTVLLVQP